MFIIYVSLRFRNSKGKLKIRTFGLDLVNYENRKLCKKAKMITGRIPKRHEGGWRSNRKR